MKGSAILSMDQQKKDGRLGAGGGDFRGKWSCPARIIFAMGTKEVFSPTCMLDFSVADFNNSRHGDDHSIGNTAGRERSKSRVIYKKSSYKLKPSLFQ